MLGIILYLFAAAATGGIVSFLFVVTRPVHIRDDFRPWKSFIISFVLALALPYVAFEFMTKKFGPSMKKTVEYGLAEAEIDGELQYYKVLFSDGKTATVLAIAEEKADWGGMDRPVVRMKLKKKSETKWALESYMVLVSDDLQKDHVVFPPFY